VPEVRPIRARDYILCCMLKRMNDSGNVLGLFVSWGFRASLRLFEKVFVIRSKSLPALLV
jgi:hypothetical protein